MMNAAMTGHNDTVYLFHTPFNANPTLRDNKGRLADEFALIYRPQAIDVLNTLREWIRKYNDDVNSGQSDNGDDQMAD